MFLETERKNKGLGIYRIMKGRETTRKMVPITGRARSFLVFLEFSKTK